MKPGAVVLSAACGLLTFVLLVVTGLLCVDFVRDLLSLHATHSHETDIHKKPPLSILVLFCKDGRIFVNLAAALTCGIIFGVCSVLMETDMISHRSPVAIIVRLTPYFLFSLLVFLSYSAMMVCFNSLIPYNFCSCIENHTKKKR